MSTSAGHRAFQEPESINRAVRRLRRVVDSDDSDDGSDLLQQAADAGAVAVRLAVGHLADADRVVRAAACDLLGSTSAVHGDDVRREAATALIALSDTETDAEVHWSIARALGATCDPRALPTLVTLARSPDSDVRFQVAAAVPMVLDDPPAEAGEAVLIDLCTDPDPTVREWATFGLGWMSTADGNAVRRALWDRTRDTHDEVRADAARGLARRRDARALPLVRELLAQDEVHRLTFQAAAYLGDPSLLPLLDGFDPTAGGVAEALLECDPVRRAERDESVWRILESIHRRRPELRITVFGERCDLGLYLDVTDGADVAAHWFADGLLMRRAGNDPERAADLAIADLDR
ncbi:HEAT repeat domain-containing protein [Micromonospora lupini]|uniref:PBS lyase containing HEAT repeats n=1 Tax=Micromonospora lupini str. Lupac 08 TaxID=1150864 RepID=I0KZC5_9ACTN|nr:HEAT repeat domain-containing protein [Micromonospora lupini]CCH16922.1 PBS lyase containing HEAT repeats [Micromonospora lupini str. Lupac 08]